METKEIIAVLLIIIAAVGFYLALKNVSRRKLSCAYFQ